MARLLDVPYLTATIGGQLQVFTLHPGVAVHIGRGSPNTVALVDGPVSRTHAMIMTTASGQTYLTDLGSRNGTFLNGSRVTAPALLRDGDEMAIGDYILVFHTPLNAPRASESEALNPTELLLRLHRVTVLVADVRDYTTLTQRLGDARMAQVMSSFLRDAGAALKQHGVYMEKYLGDAVMAVWVHDGNRGEADCVLEIFSALAAIRSAAAESPRRLQLDTPLALGMGLNSGRASLGNLSGADGDQTALGDVITMAFRLEAATKNVGCEILVGDSTRALVGKIAAVDDLFEPCTVTLKGYEGTRQAHQLNPRSLDLLLARLRDTIAATEASAGEGTGSP